MIKIHSFHTNFLLITPFYLANNIKIHYIGKILPSTGLEDHLFEFYNV